jgi:hypothetical protein
LKALYTHTSAKDILATRWNLAAVTNDAMADTQPLRALLRKHVDRAFLTAIADEYAKGHELWIATTNLDSRVRYIWNMARIAASQHDRRRGGRAAVSGNARRRRGHGSGLRISYRPGLRGVGRRV